MFLSALVQEGSVAAKEVARKEAWAADVTALATTIYLKLGPGAEAHEGQHL